jgi:hypothetical protein
LSSNTTASKNIKQEYSKMMNPPEIINKNYTPDQEGQEIRQEDVVRPLNRKITTMNECAKWKEISRSRAPAYGSCEYVSGGDLLVNVAIDATMGNMKPSYS